MVILNPFKPNFRSFLFHIASILAVFATAAPAFAEECKVIVVKSADLKPHQDVLRGFKDVCFCSVREVKLKESDSLDKILRKKPDLVFTIGAFALKKVRSLKDLPIVYALSVLPETDRELSLNISGVNMDVPPDAYLAAMKEVFSGANRVGLLYDPKNTQSFVDKATRSFSEGGVELTAVRISGNAGLASTLGDLRGKIDILWMLPDPSVVTPETVEYLLRFSIQNNVPIFTFSKKYVEMGAIASLDVDPYDMGAQAADIANMLVTGQKGPIRVSPRTHHLSVNMKAAKKMGIRITDELGRKVNNVE